jgi:hypothetical protein
LYNEKGVIDKIKLKKLLIGKLGKNWEIQINKFINDKLVDFDVYKDDTEDIALNFMVKDVKEYDYNKPSR